MNWFAAWADWLHAAYGTKPIVVQGMEVTPATQAAYQLGYRCGQAEGMQLGLAQGELKGRTELADELEAQYGVDAREDLDPQAVRRIRLRQVH